jgi:putative membrane protein
MTSSPVPEGTTGTLRPPLSDGQVPAAAPELAVPELQTRPTHTRISGIRTGMIAGAVGLIVVMIFIIQNTRAVNISFLGAHLRLSLAVALFLAAIGGALLMAAAGTARITQLRRIMRRNRDKAQAN